MASLKVQFNSETNGFELIDTTNDTVQQEVVYGYPWTPIPSTDALHLPLWSSALTEAHVIRLTIPSTEGEKTVGWLCTVSALTSKTHDYWESPYFRAAAGHAVQVLLEDDAIQQALCKTNNPSLETFPAGACVFISMRSLLPAEISSQPTRLYPLLHMHGFLPYVFGRNSMHSAGAIACGNLLANKKIATLKLRLTSNAVPASFLSFVDKLLSQPLSVTQESPYRFFLYYQIIELLMEEVQRQKTLQFALKLQDSGEDATKLYELMQEIKDHTSELGRITALIHSFTNVDAVQLKGLTSECLNFLAKMDRTGTTNSCSTALYAVRNMLIHNMRRISPDALALMPLINEYLEVVVPSMLLSFNSPLQANLAVENAA
ncbi:hypothetical protein [Polaromonas sp.]|uniref:hypothetical protein n=1 Tax=Polaromonas sp. TaxID=1869339 RepID=UPI003BACEC5F